MAVSKSIESPSDARLKQRASVARGSAPSHTKATDSTNHKQPRDAATSPNDATTLAHEMPRMLLRLSVVTVTIACVAVLAALTFPAVHSSLWTSKRQFELASTKAAFHAAATTSAAKSAVSITGVPTVEVLAVYPHDPRAFTQGLLVAEQGTEKFFIESTGLYGESSLRKVDITTGEVRATHLLGSHLFGEGVTLDKNGELVMITWKSKTGFTFELTPSFEFKMKREFTFSTSTGEGWGIDYDGTHFVVSDGSSKIHFWDPTTLQQVREITVTINGQEIPKLNELEFANGYIYANVWYQSVIVKIDPADGQIVAVFDCTDLVTQSGADVNSGAVLNGIAYDGEEDVFYITGKLWSRVFKPSVEILAVYPRDPEGYIQGLLVVRQGGHTFFIESTGQYGGSGVRKVDITTGQVLAQFVLDLDAISHTFVLKRKFDYSTTTNHAWGLDHYGTHLFVSDSSPVITFWNESTMEVVRRVHVTHDGKPIPYENELEFDKGYIYANIWLLSAIVKIDSTSGEVVAIFDCSELVKRVGKLPIPSEAFNGIAYDGEEDVFYLTGKLWSHVFKVRLLD